MKEKAELARRQRRGISFRNLNWAVVTGISAMHVGAVIAPFYFSWSGVLVALFFVWFTGALGITLCYHRLLTHRSFKTPKWFECVLATIGTCAWQGGPCQWVGTHRIHHRHSDREQDPHSPRHGFGWAHVFWCMHKETEGVRARDAARDLLRDPALRLIDRYFWVPQLALIPLLYAGGSGAAALGLSTSGLSWVLWGVCVRTVFVYHGTWFINSASHVWGYRNYDTHDDSRNLWWLALVSFGEGWHNNHHAHPRSAAHGLRWFEFDATYLTIRLLERIGLARDVVLPRAGEQPGPRPPEARTT